MNFGSKEWVMSLTLMVGGVPALWAIMVTGNGTPADDYRLANPTAIQQFISSHPKLSPDDLTQFSAEIVHNDRMESDASASPIMGVATPPSIPAPTPFSRTITAGARAAASSSSDPCPNGWTYNKGASVCFQNVESCLTYPGDPNDHYELDSEFVVGSNGNHALYTNDDGSLTYGEIFMRLVDPNPNHLLYVGQYEAYFFATAQDESTFVQSICGSHPVVYKTPPDTKPTGGYSYQVNVVDNVPDGASSDNQTLSPYQSWATNLCPLPTITSSN